MAERGVAAVPTVVSYVYLFDQNQGGYFGSTSRRFTFDHRSNLEMVRRLLEAGVKVGVGTDLIFDSYRYLPESYVWELKYLVSAGMSIQEALIAATRTNAEILDMDDRLGHFAAWEAGGHPRRGRGAGPRPGRAGTASPRSKGRSGGSTGW